MWVRDEKAPDTLIKYWRDKTFCLYHFAPFTMHRARPRGCYLRVWASWDAKWRFVGIETWSDVGLCWNILIDKFVNLNRLIICPCGSGAFIGGKQEWLPLALFVHSHVTVRDCQMCTPCCLFCPAILSFFYLMSKLPCFFSMFTAPKWPKTKTTKLTSIPSFSIWLPFAWSYFYKAKFALLENKEIHWFC